MTQPDCYVLSVVVRVQTEPRAFRGRKMVAFANSMYGGDEVTHAMTACLEGLQVQKEKETVKEAERLARLEYVRRRKVRACLCFQRDIIVWKRC